jgi:hypothetical protein
MASALELAPEAQTRRLAWSAAGWGLLIVLGLQLWRPYFFLTDDNLVGFYPVLSAIGRNIARGQSPFWLSTLFGGFDLLRDPSTLCLWNPFVLALALLAQTPARLAVIDIFVGAHLMLAAFCCAHLLGLWRARFALSLSDRRLIFLSVSYAFSAYSIIVCASWSTFAVNIAAAPLSLLGMFHARRRAGIWLVAASTVLGILGGHLSPFAWASVSLSLFAVLWPIASRTGAASTCGQGAQAGAWEVSLRWFGGAALGVALCSPLLWMASSGFVGTARNAAFSSGEVLQAKVPALTFVLSWLVGSLSALSNPTAPLFFFGLSVGASGAIVAVASAHFVLFSVLRRGISWTRLDSLFAFFALGVVLLVARPAWMQEVVGRLPMLRSMRFPFREVWLFHLWTHLWMAWRGVVLPSRVARLSAVSGAFVLAASLLAWKPPTFSHHGATRDWVTSGRAERFWAWMKPQLPPGSRLLPVSTSAQWEHYDRVPWSLVCAFNFPALFDVPSQSGYVIKGLEHGRVRRGQVGGPAGLRSPAEAEDALRRDPRLILVRITSLQPLVLEFQGQHFRRTVRPADVSP